MIRRALAVAALMTSTLGFTYGPSASASGEQPGCRDSLGLGGATPVDPDYCDGRVRPGVRIATSRGTCTANFLFRGANGKRFLGTAGHCFLSANGERTSFSDPTVWAYTNGWMTIGKVVYAVLDDRDFALIELDWGVSASAEMAHFGGPTGVYHAHSPLPEVVHHYGFGTMISDIFAARTSLALNTLTEVRVGALGAATWGDSGGPAITGDGRALGVVVTIGNLSASAGTVGISRLDYVLPFAEQAIGTTLTIQTAPRRA